MAVFDTEHCPNRGPGLTHTSRNGNCTTCGDLVIHGSGTTGVMPADRPPAPLERAYREAPVDCGCFDCRHPSQSNAGVRYDHKVAHDLFESWLRGRREARA